MAIKFAGDRHFSTASSVHIFNNQAVASYLLTIKVNSATPPGIPFDTNLVARDGGTVNFGFALEPTLGANVGLRVRMNGVSGSVAHDIQLTLGGVYVIGAVWDGNAAVQTMYVNGLATVIGHVGGRTSNRTDPIFLGMLASSPYIVYTLDDLLGWDGYGLTLDDAAHLTQGGDPLPVGAGALFRGRHTLSGPTGVAVAAGDAGLRNSLGAGPDFTVATGTGTAVYTPSLVWGPTVTAHPYVAGCRKMIAITLTSTLDGSAQVPAAVNAVPHLIVNGVDLGSLTIPAFPLGVHQCLLYSTPGAVAIGPDDVASLTAPLAWCNTATDVVGALSGTIENRSGRSSVQVESLTKTLRLGLNMSYPGNLEYYPWKNLRHVVGIWDSRGKLAPAHGYQVTTSPGETGLWLLKWNATVPLTPALFALATLSPSLVTITERVDLRFSPADGVGYVRVFDVQPVADSAWQTTPAGFLVNLNYDDPAYDGVHPNYEDLWIVPPGEWSLVDGQAVLDRTDKYALSTVFLDRVTQELGGLRWCDMLQGGAIGDTCPYPELLPPPGIEYFWANYLFTGRIGYTSLGPVDVTATPWIYHWSFGKPGLPGQAYTAMLSSNITTTPAVGTHEVYTFADAATAPLMTGSEILFPSGEICRVLAISGTSVTLYRGSNGTTPLPQVAGPATVYGRQPITNVMRSNGTANTGVPSLITCNVPHNVMTMQGLATQSAFDITLAGGAHVPNFRLGYTFVTGPNTFVSISLGYPTAGDKPNGVYTLDPTQKYAQTKYQAARLDIYANATGRLPHANLYVNLPVDAVDDMWYTYARIVRDNFPAGRKVYVENGNEPWNFAGAFQTFGYTQFMNVLGMPSNLNTFPTAYNCYRATQGHRIFREVFAAAGRGDEIVGVMNVQMGSGSSQITPALNLALALGEPLKGIACAPYYSMTPYPASVAAFNQYDDDQAAEQLLHDITYDPTQLAGWIKNNKDAVDAYNLANGKSCILMAYEGSLEYAAPAGAIRRDHRSRDIQYNPGIYDAMQGWAKLLQQLGIVAAHIYGLGIGWPNSWGLYHMRRQRHSRGDGLHGASDNRHVLVDPASPYYDGGSDLAHASWKQDLLLDSPRGQQLIDWLMSFSTMPQPLAELTQWMGNWYKRWFPGKRG